MNKYRRTKLIFFSGLFCGGLLSLMGLRINPVLYLVGIGIVVAVFIYENKNYRCPNCNTHFDIRSSVPDFCPKCGQKL